MKMIDQLTIRVANHEVCENAAPGVQAVFYFCELFLQISGITSKAKIRNRNTHIGY